MSQSWEEYFTSKETSILPRLKRWISNLGLLHKSHNDMLLDRQQRSSQSANSLLPDEEIIMSESVLHKLDRSQLSDLRRFNILESAITRLTDMTSNDWYLQEAIDAGVQQQQNTVSWTYARIHQQELDALSINEQQTQPPLVNIPWKRL